MKKPAYLATILLFSATQAFSQITGEAAVFQYTGGYRTYRWINPSTIIGRTVLPDTSKAQPAVDQFSIIAYPNPASDYITIENKGWGDKDQATVRLFDITGKLISTKIFTEAKGNIPLQGLAPGTYQLHYYMRNNLVANFKVVKH